MAVGILMLYEEDNDLDEVNEESDYFVKQDGGNNYCVTTPQQTYFLSFLNDYTEQLPKCIEFLRSKNCTDIYVMTIPESKDMEEYFEGQDDVHHFWGNDKFDWCGGKKSRLAQFIADYIDEFEEGLYSSESTEGEEDDDDEDYVDEGESESEDDEEGDDEEEEEGDDEEEEEEEDDDEDEE